MENCHLLNTYESAAEGLIVLRRRIADVGYPEDLWLCVRDGMCLLGRARSCAAEDQRRKLSGNGPQRVTVLRAEPSWRARKAPRYGRD
jgi:hypothetical protein